jgi:hypothetical protein
MKLKNLRKKMRRLEKRLREGPKKLAKLRHKLEAMEAAKALRAARRSAAGVTAPRPAAKPSTSVEKKSPAQAGGEKPGSVKKAKKSLNLLPERRAQLAAAMKARTAKGAAEASATPASADDRYSAPASTSQTPELAPALAAVPMPPEAARRIEPSDEEIRVRAYFLSERRCRFALPGDADSDWYEAKRQLLSESGELSEHSTITTEEPSEISSQHEPAVKKFQQECSGHTDSQRCKEEHDALVKALGEFLTMVQNGLKLIDAHAGDASDADFQKQIEALRARAQQHLQWGQEQLKALAH